MDRVLGNPRRPFRQHRQPLHGFTLIELLVVVAVIAALLAILMPSMGRAIAVTRTAVCSANFHSKVQAFITYAADHKGALPVFVSKTAGSTYHTGRAVPEALIKYGLATNDPNNPASLSGYYTNYRGASTSAWNCPSVEKYLHFYDAGGGVVSFISFPTTNVITGLNGHPHFMGTHSPRTLQDGNGPILAETVRSNAAGVPAAPSFHPDGRVVHAFSNGYVAAIDYRSFSYEIGLPAPKHNQWGLGPASWYWFWSQDP